MQIKTETVVTILALMLFGTSYTAVAQDVKNGGPTGQIQSASAQDASDAIVVFTTPATGHFILTQFCTTPISPGIGAVVMLGGSSFGTIPTNFGLALDACTTFSPGIALPQSETLTCFREGVSFRDIICMVTGVLSSK